MKHRPSCPCPTCQTFAARGAITLDDEWSYPLHTSGSCSTLPKEPENETIAALHAIVKEITGKDVEQPVKPRMGFLP